MPDSLAEARPGLTTAWLTGASRRNARIYQTFTTSERLQIGKILAWNPGGLFRFIWSALI